MWRGLIFTSLFLSVLSLPKNPREVTSLDSCIDKSTKVIARAMLQGYADIEKNMVFSPLGYSTLFAILAEGSHGGTEEELSEKLYLHRENVKQRNEYKDILSTLKEKYKTNKPQLHTWFYVYKNYSVEEDYKNILKEYYLTEVKNVYPVEFEAATRTKDTTSEESEIRDMERFALAEDSGNSAYYEKQIIKQAEKEDELFKSGEKVQDGSISNYPIPQDGSNSPSEGNVEINDESLTSIQNDHVMPENEQPNQHTQLQNVAELQEDKTKAKEKITNDKSHILHDKISLGIDPINFLPEAFKKGRKADNDKESLMIIFNGYYFEGTWEVPFDKNVSQCHFHLNDTMKVNATAIKTKGVFKAGELPQLNGSAISIPFQGGRYSLVIVLPNACDGLDQLITDLNDSSIKEVVDSLEEKELEVQIPKFNLEFTSNPAPSLIEIGITSLFSGDADLSGISKAGKLHAEELVQLVTMKITENIGTVNYMTASSVSSRSIKGKFIANHPFLFFIEDNSFNVTVVAGKLLDPTAVPL